MGTWTTTGLFTAVSVLTGYQTSVILKVRLFTNAFEPTTDSVAADFVWSDLPGGGEVQLNPVSWVAGISTGTATYHYPTIQFVFTGNPNGRTIYGYGLWETKSSTVLWADTISPAYTPPVTGGILPLNIWLYASNINVC